METRHYRYPAEVQNFKALSKFFLFLYLFLSGVGILGYQLSYYTEPVGYYYLLIGFPLAIFFVVFHLGDYPDVKADDKGLYVEFLWAYLPVPWEDIIEIKHFRFLFLEWWLITTRNHLTFFHRLYSVYSLKSFLPGFLIHHKSSKDQSDLMKLIRGQVKSKSKAARSS
jgi:hypothetical protein